MTETTKEDPERAKPRGGRRPTALRARYTEQLTAFETRSTRDRVRAMATTHGLSQAKVLRAIVAAGIDHVEEDPERVKPRGGKRPSHPPPRYTEQLTALETRSTRDRVYAMAREHGLSRVKILRAIVAAGIDHVEAGLDGGTIRPDALA